MIREGRAKGIEFVLPVDFVLQDGRVSATIGPGNQQFDVGPATGQLFAETVGEFIAAHKNDRPPAVVFHNGVFGMFEDPRFEEGTRSFMAQLKRMTDAGIKVYIGGGEGGTALEKYGQPDWVTYCLHGRRHGAQRPGQRAGAVPGGVGPGGKEEAGLALPRPRLCLRLWSLAGAEGRNQRGDVSADGLPDFLQVHSVVLVNQYVAHPSDLPPRNAWISLLKLACQPRDGFAENEKLMEHGGLGLGIGHERRFVELPDERHSEACRLKDVRQRCVIARHRPPAWRPGSLLAGYD